MDLKVVLNFSYIMQPNEGDDKLELNEFGNTLMTRKNVQYFCEKQGLFDTPDLNDRLYLQHRGFQKIEGEVMSLYLNVITVWLNNNAIKKIQGLEKNIAVTSLYLNHNSISRIENLSTLKRLTLLNLAQNQIEVITSLEEFPLLENINLSSNYLTNAQGITNLQQCPTLTSIDLSKNQLQNTEQTLKCLLKLSNTVCLYLKGSPLAQSLKNYRKTLIGSLPKLKFLDDRPVLEKDHRQAEAWLKGGVQAEKQQKTRIFAEQQILSRQPMKQAQKEVEEKLHQTVEELKSSQNVNQYKVQQKQEEHEEKEEAELPTMELKMKIEAVEVIKQVQPQENIRGKVEKTIGRKIFEADQENIHQKIAKKWQQKFEKLLEVLLEKYRFDFWEVQPSFNMIINDINKKTMKPAIRFEVDELRAIWTKLERTRRED